MKAAHGPESKHNLYFFSEGGGGVEAVVLHF